VLLVDPSRKLDSSDAVPQPSPEDWQLLMNLNTKVRAISALRSITKRSLTVSLSGTHSRRFVIFLFPFLAAPVHALPFIRPPPSPQGRSRRQTRQGNSLRSEHSRRGP